MRALSLSRVTDVVLHTRMDRMFGHERKSTAWMLVHIAEYDDRRLFRERGYPSMHAYCVQHGRLSEDAAYKRIQAARIARQFPVIFDDVAAGRLHLTGVGLLAPHLTSENAQELLAAAYGKTKTEIEVMLRERFPRSEMLGLVEAAPSMPELAPAQATPACPTRPELAPAQVGGSERSTLKPLAPKRFHLHLSMDESLHDLLRYAQDLMSHQLPSGDMTEVIRGALHLLVAKLEKRKFAATDRPAGTTRATRSRRHIPAAVKQAVWKRDGARCTFVSDDGRRCDARKFLEFDHILEVARGGSATIDGIRLRCRAHNQLAAEQAFGAGFMDRKREQARLAVEERARAATEASRQAAETAARAEDERARATAEVERTRRERADEVIPYLRQLGFRLEQARGAARHCLSLADRSLEDRVRAALSHLAPASRHVPAA